MIWTKISVVSSIRGVLKSREEPFANSRRIIFERHVSIHPSIAQIVEIDTKTSYDPQCGTSCTLSKESFEWGETGAGSTTITKVIPRPLTSTPRLARNLLRQPGLEARSRVRRTAASTRWCTSYYSPKTYFSRGNYLAKVSYFVDGARRDVV